jgi:laccase
MNGKGLCKECSNDTAPTNTTTQTTFADGSSSESTLTCQGKREHLIVEQGKTYLLRLVNAASLGYYSFAIAGHSLTIIGAGSAPTAPRVVNSVELSAGERLNFTLVLFIARY